MSIDDRDWISGAVSRGGTLAALWIGSIGLLVLGLQPILLGAMFTEGKVDFDGLALIATAEIIAIAIGSTMGGLLGIRRGLPTKAGILLVLLSALNATMWVASGLTGYLVLRTLAGFVEGGLVIVAIELIARSRHAQRLGGWFVTLQTVAQSLIALALALWIIPAWGSAGGFATLGFVSLVSLLVIGHAPDGYAPLPKSDLTLDGVFTPRSVIALLSIFAFFCFIGAVWAFLEPIGALSGIDAVTVGTIVSASLAVQVVGALAATWAADRVSYALGIAACCVVGLIAVLVLAGTPSVFVFWVAALAIGFVWMFIIPCQVGMAVAADETRATATLVPAANLFGAALGPLFAAFFIVGPDVGVVPMFGLGAAAVSLVLLVVFVIISRR